MRILVTGGTGFIGSHAVRMLCPRHKLYVLARSRPPQDLRPHINWIQHDLTTPLDYSHLPKDVDAIIHLAQSRFYRKFPDRAKDIFDVNIAGTFSLLDYARQVGVECFVYASSGGVYGYSYEKFVETDPVSPLNFYLSSKYSSELLIANYQPFFRTVVLRFFFVYGSGQEGMLIPSLMHKVKTGETVPVEGNPGLQINPIHVEDAARVFESALHLRTSDLFNVAGDEVVTITDLVKLIEKVSGKKALIQHTDGLRNGDLVGDNTRMKEVLKVYPRIPLLEGLSSMELMD